MARLPEGALMQRAASGLAYAVLDLLDRAYGARVLLLVGSGDNGGDALYAGVLLARRGVRVEVLLLSPDKVHAAGLAALRDAGGRVVDPGGPVARPDVVVDGIVGIGGRGGLREDAAAVVRGLADVPVVAVDIPSGVDVDTGDPRRSARHRGRHRHLRHPQGRAPGRPRGAGLWRRAPGGPRPRPAGPPGHGAAGGRRTRPAAPAGARRPQVHPRRRRRPGGLAAVPRCRRALRLRRRRGAGRDGALPRRGRRPGARGASRGRRRRGTRAGLGDRVRRGLGRRAGAERRAGRRRPRGGRRRRADPRDRTARRARAAHPARRGARRGCSTSSASRSRRSSCGSRAAAAQRYDAVVLLKGRHTLVATPSGEVRVTTGGPAWLATAGAGDVLAGLCGSLVAAGLDPFDAGVGGLLAARSRSGRGGRRRARDGPRRRAGPAGTAALAARARSGHDPARDRGAAPSSSSTSTRSRPTSRTSSERAGGAAMMTVVKADGYGHGIIEAARAARAGGADWLGTAVTEEALALREAGDTGRILTWLAVPGEDYTRPIEADVDVTAYSVGRGRGDRCRRSAARRPCPGPAEGGHRPEPWRGQGRGLAAARRGRRRRRAGRSHPGGRHLVALRVQRRAGPPAERRPGEGVRRGARGRRRGRHRARRSGTSPTPRGRCCGRGRPTTWSGAASRPTDSRLRPTSSPPTSSGWFRR